MIKRSLFLGLLVLLFGMGSAVAAPMSDWVNVRDFGAKGDGLSDDTAALQKCFDTLENGMTIYFPAGTYNVSSMLTLHHKEKRLLGVNFIGEGADKTIFLWKGPLYGRVFRIAGFAHSRFVDFCVDGANRAAIGFWSDTENKFQTQDRYTRLAFRNFRSAGFFSEPNNFDGTSDSEPTFEYCLFERCARGIRFESWNDYDFTIRGCTFRENSVAGIDCSHGCFYASACRFERNKIDVNAAPPEHASSVRRCVSVGSGIFLAGGCSVTPVTVENCTVADWKNPNGAIQYNGAICGFSNTFEPGKVEKIYASKRADYFLSGENAPEGARKPLALSRNTIFEPRRWKDGKVFDAKRDFGAKGNGKDDDTAALKAMIAAACAEGNGAVAFLPTGYYLTTETLEIGGADWTLRGNSLCSVILYDGDHEKPAILVKEAQNVELALFWVQNRDSYFGDHKLPWDGKKGANILLVGGEKPSSVTYREIFAFGKYETGALHNALREGYVFRDLGEKDVVNLNYIEGNMRFENCGDATIIGGVCYEGAVVVDGPTGKGFIGCQTRLATLTVCPLIVRKNGSFVASDFYLEQEKDFFYRLNGGEQYPRGRITMGHPKVSRELPEGQKVDPDFQRWDFLKDEGWCGDFCLVAPQFYKAQSALNESVFYAGKGMSVNIISPVYYSSYPVVQGEGTLSVFSGSGTTKNKPANVAPTSVVADAFGDLTRLGELDLKYNYTIKE